MKLCLQFNHLKILFKIPPPSFSLLALTYSIELTSPLIDNSSLSIKNMDVSFSKPSNFGALYSCVLKNEGKYTAYLDYERFVELYYNGFLDCKILGDNYSEESSFMSRAIVDALHEE